MADYELRPPHPVPARVAVTPVATVRLQPASVEPSRRRRGESRYVRALVTTTICLIALMWAAGRTPVPGLVNDTDAAFVDSPEPTTPVETPEQSAEASGPAHTSGKPSAAREVVEIPAAAGYIFSFGVVQIDRKRVTIRLAGGCAAGGETPPLSFQGASFRYRGKLKGSPVTVVVSGRIVREDRLSIRLRLAGKGCPSNARQIVARLS